MISHLNQYIIDGMTHSYKIVCIFLLCTVRYIFFGTKVISRLIGLIYENIAKMANKIFNVPNHLKTTNHTAYVVAMTTRYDVVFYLRLLGGKINC